LGDLRPLVCPEPDIAINEVRYGGIHQGLSGARTMDVTGHRADYTFEFKYLEQSEYRFLEAMHSRVIWGPYWLINPLKKNRLSLQATRGLVSRYERAGVRLPTGSTHVMESAYPASIDLPGRSIAFSGWTEIAPRVRFDHDKFIPVLPGEAITASVWLGSPQGVPYLGATIQLDWFDKDKQPLTPTVSPAFDITPTWTMHMLSNITPPAGAAACRFSIGLTSTNTTVYLAAPQVEAGAVATEFEVGGAAPEVLIDQIETPSPRFPLRDATLTLLEA
jgi:hypothetical protein